MKGSVVALIETDGDDTELNLLLDAVIVPTQLSCPGVHGCERFQARDGAYLNRYELDTSGEAESGEMLEALRSCLSETAAHLSARSLWFVANGGRQDGMAPKAFTLRGPHFIAITLPRDGSSPDGASPTLLGRQGFLRYDYYKASDLQQSGPPFLEIYEVATPEVLTGRDPLVAYTQRPSPWLVSVP